MYQKIKSGPTKTLIFLLLAGWSQTPGQITVREDSRPVTLSWSLSHYATEFCTTAENLYARYGFEDCGFTVEAGKPLLPLASVMVPLPDGCVDIRPELVYQEHETKRTYPVWPNYQRQVSDREGVRYVFQQDQSVYSQNAWYPQRQIDHEIVAIRDRRYAVIRIYPLLYHPLQQQLKVATRLEYILHFLSSRPKVAAPAKVTGSWMPAGGNYYKVSIDHAGLYRIYGLRLQEAGSDIYQMDPWHIRLFNKGEQQPLTVYTGPDSIMDPGDYIQFYADVRYDSVYLCDHFTDRNVYWLEVNSDSIGRFTTERSVPAGIGQTIHETYGTVHYEKDSLVYSNNRDSITLKYYWKKIAYSPYTENILFPVSYPSATDSTRLKIKFRGWTSVTGVNPDHHLLFRINGQPLPEFYCDGDGIIMYETLLPAGYLQHGSNLLTIELPGDTPAGYVDVLYLDWFELTGGKKTIAENDRLHFEAQPEGDSTVQHFVVDSLTTDSLFIYAIDDGVYISDYEIDTVDGGRYYRLTFSDSIARRKEFLVLSEAGIDTSLKLVRDTAYNLQVPGQQYDYIIITHPDLEEAALQLKAWREQHNGFSVTIALIGEIMDECNYGIFNPVSIQRYLSFMYEHGADPKPRYVVLLGDASWDYKKAEYDKQNAVPSLGNPANDNYFACVAGTDYLPDLYVGRLPAADPGEAAIMIDKIIAYESDSTGGAWRGRFMFLNGGQDASERASFAAQTNSIVSSCLDPTAYYHTVQVINKQLDDCVWDENLDTILAAFNQGALWVNFAGHGGSWTWDCMFSYNNLAQVSNRTCLPFVTSMTCHTGRFAEPYLECFGEAFLKENTNGAIAFLGTSGWGYIEGDYYLSKNLYSAVMQKGYFDLGRAVTDAKINLYASFGATYRELIENYTLLGDPAIKLKLPAKPDLVIDASRFTFYPETPYAGNPVEIGYTIRNFGYHLQDSILVAFYWDFPGDPDHLIEKKNIAITLLDTPLTSHWLPPAGQDRYTIYLVIDEADNITEFDETNNTIARELTIYTQPVIVIRPFDKSLEGTVPMLVAGSSRYSDDTLVYYFELDTVAQFNTLFKKASGPVRSALNFAGWKPDTLTTGQTYFWQARVFNGVQYSQWSDYVSFTLQVKDTSRAWGEYHQTQFMTDSLDTVIGVKPEGMRLKQLADTVDISRYDSGATVAWISSQVYHTDPRNLIGGAFDVTVPGEAQNFIFGTPDTMQRAVIDLGGSFPVKKVASHHYGGLGDREVWSYFSISTSTDSNTWQLWGKAGPFAVPDNNISDKIAYERETAIPVRYLLYNYGRNSPDYGGSGSRIVEVYAYQGAYPAEAAVVSSPIGPSLHWDSLGFQAVKDSGTRVSLAVIGYHRTARTWQVLPGYDTISDSFLDLSGLDATQYPYIKLAGTLATDDRYLTPGLTGWSVFFKPAGELILSSMDLVRDSLPVGDIMSVSWIIHSQGYAALESCLVRVWDICDNLRQALLDTAIDLDVNTSVPLAVSWCPIEVGYHQILVEVNPDSGQPEFYYGNNQTVKDLVVYNINSLPERIKPPTICIKYFSCCPHPAHQGVDIRFWINQKAPINFTILDSKGRVLTAIHRDGVAGYNHMQWDGCDRQGKQQPAGVYYIGIRAGSTFHISPLLKLE